VRPARRAPPLPRAGAAPSAPRRRWGRAPRLAGAAMTIAASVLAAAAAVAAPGRAARGEIAALARDLPARTAYMRRAGAAAGLRAVRLDSVSPYLACAVVKAEDRAFFAHGALDWGQTWRAAWSAARGGPVTGASTVSQQLARNLWLGPERSPVRKLREAGLARALERGVGKRRILEIYLNVAEWGPGVWGADAAAMHWFGRPASRLDPFESAVLASLLPAPRAPLRGANALRAWRTQRRVADQLYRAGMLSDDQWWSAVARSDALLAALRAGTPVRAALAARGDPGPRLLAPPPRPAGPPLSPSIALRQACGLPRELAAERIRTRSRT